MQIRGFIVKKLEIAIILQKVIIVVRVIPIGVETALIRIGVVVPPK